MKFRWEPRAPARLRYLNSVFFMNLFSILFLFAFILPSLMKPSGLTVALPSVVSSEPLGTESASIVIRHDDAVFLNSRNIPIKDLKGELSRRFRKDFQVLIKADEQAHIAALARVWDICRQAGAVKVDIATNEELIHY